MSDNKIIYTPINNLVVDVTVQGSFYLVNGEPDLCHPVHLVENTKGLDLRGEERKIIGMKASDKGAASVYRQGMAFIQ